MERHVAVYWDFENVHASLCTVKWGPEWYRENRFTKQPKLVDIGSIMEFVAGLGQININKAYANWGFFFPYNYELQWYSVDLIQLFPRGSHGKNGADIRMAIDVIEDITLNPHITTVVIVASDSDYISVAQKVRQKGKELIGIGVKETTNNFWPMACNEFKFYSSLLVKSSAVEDLEAEGYESGDMDEARELICKAVRRIMESTGEPYALKAAIKPMIQRLDPSFDEGNYGFRTFNDMLDACRDVISLAQGEFDHLVALKDAAAESLVPPAAELRLHPYQRILRKQQIRLPAAPQLHALIDETFRLFAEHGQVHSYQAYRELMRERLKAAGRSVPDADVSKVKAILYKAFCFQLDATHQSIRLAPGITSEEALRQRVLRALVKRVLDNIDVEEIDTAAFSELLWGDAGHAATAEALVEEYRAVQASREAD